MEEEIASPYRCLSAEGTVFILEVADAAGRGITVGNPIKQCVFIVCLCVHVSVYVFVYVCAHVHRQVHAHMCTYM